jgi:DNA-binding CsgD family transcriptional regulator
MTWCELEIDVGGLSITCACNVVMNCIPGLISMLNFPNDLELTYQQKRILSLLYNGLTVVKIAERLELSPYTVRNHITQIYKQTGLGRVELIKALAQLNGKDT